MADFCAQCSIEIFGADFGDLDTGQRAPPTPYGTEPALTHAYYPQICEGCGYTFCDSRGWCNDHFCPEHGLRALAQGCLP